jgi:multifunctional 2-oxoglutarate metabolism enzyme
MATGTTAAQIIDVVTPAAGESVTEGTILEWHVKVGDAIKLDETIVEISTDKVDVELPAPATGVVSELLVEEGDTVTVGQVIARIAVGGEGGGPAASDGNGSSPGNGSGAAAQGDGNGAASATEPATEQAVSSPPTSSAPASPAPQGDGAGSGQIVDVLTPAAGESVAEGTILEWHAKVGDFIKESDTIVEISTDKVDVELPAPASGTVTELLAEEGETVTVGQVIARIEVGAADGAGASGATNGSGDGAASDGASAQPTGGQLPEGTKVSPVAARAAAAEGVDLASVSGSGPAGRITKSDVLSAASGNGGAQASSAPAADGASAPTQAETKVMKGSAAALARYMDQSRSIPTATSFRTLTVTMLDARRKELKAGERKVSFTHLIAYAIARASDDMPVMADHFEEIDGKPNRVHDGQVNLGLAVDVEKKDGSRTLMVPVIRDAGRMPFERFVAAYDALVEKARTNTLTADDLQGGNVTLTNPGGIGTIASVPRLMTGQGTIVATGSIAYPPGLANIGAMIGAEKVMTMTSTYDHRIIQGAESGRFLARIDEYLSGERGFYDGVFASLGVELGPAPPPPAPAAAAAASTAAASSAASDGSSPIAVNEELLRGVQAATTLVSRFRSHGHLAARLDPLDSEPEGDPGLDPEPLGLAPEIQAKIPAKVLQMYVPGATLADALPHLRETYCGTIAYEIEHIASHRQRVWLREHIEAGSFREPLTNDESRWLLRRLVKVDALERFMHKAYLGQHQFSIEGLDMAVPMVDELIKLSAAHGGKEVVVGMAHRGRLNVLAHNLGRPYDTIFAEFEGASTLEAVTTIPQGGTGDVKYHHGTQGSYDLGNGETIRVNLESNPSHLEYVYPVVEGATRAAQTTRQGPHAHQDTDAAVPIVIHGDASFPGQGVVSETLNLQALDGYKVGGTVHIITNNQVGFTTDPDDARSTRWASDLAKGFDVPIVHVNADDVQACVSAVRLAFAFRQEFGHDVLIDLIGYRRFGHNESDEPAYTQPEMYAKIKGKKRVFELWADRLVAEGVVSQEEVDSQAQEVWDKLTLLHQRLKAKIAAAAERDGEQATGEYELDRSPSPEVETAVPAARVREIGEELLSVPDGFTVHPKLVKQLERRREALGDAGGIDWAHAEALAFASLLTEGTPIRLTGQDTERGTFSQRHMVLHDAKTGQTVCPIQSLPDALAPLELHNSPLSELACMGFEYGYSQEAPETFVLWEAQFGDFVNSAQVIVDQFIASGLAKWGQTSRLTLLLPHGYEGSGPEHSSARLERFLALAAEGNIRVASPTTPAQYFHLLRRQARIAKQRPLIVMTPKSLLRLPQATNSVADLAEGTSFQPVLAEPGVDDAQVTRLLLCTGKVYYDLVGHPDRPSHTGLAVGRVELLYPFPEGQILALMRRYPNLREVVWVQEEPRNVGARAHMFPRLMQIMPEDIRFGFIGRPERASPGEGYPAAHIAEQNRIVTTAIDLDQPVSQYPRKTPGQR